MIKKAIAGKLNVIFNNRKKYTRILLIKPLSLMENQINVTIARNRRYYNYPPYGLGILSTHLKNRGYEVSILDLNMEVLSWINEQPLETNTTDLIQNVWENKLRQRLIDFNPDLVGITCTFTMTNEMLVKTADYIKSYDKNLPVVAGGVHATNSAETVLRESKSIDFISMYEGDRSFPDLLDFINSKISEDNLSQIAVIIDNMFLYIEDRNIPTPEDISITPDYLDLAIDRYDALGEIGTFRYWRREEKRASIVLSNRGCRGTCAFCSVHRFNGRGVRSRSISSVVDEIEKMKSKYNISHITWLDDDLFYDPKRAMQLFNEIIKRNLDITWDASNGIIVSAVANFPELMDVAAQSGCIGMYFGIESGNPQILRQMRKPSTVEHCLKVGEIMQSYPQIFTRGFLIIGFPGETIKQIFDTVKLALEMSLDWYTVSLLTPLPSTELYETIVSSGQNNTSKNERLTNLVELVGYGYNVRHGESRRIIEEKGQISSKEFLFDADMDTVPTRDELNDLWLTIDYKINYEKIINQNDPFRLKKMQKFLTDVADRMTINHPLSHLFLGIVEGKLGNLPVSQKRLSLSKEYLSKSEYWKRFFTAGDIEKLYNYS